MEPNTLPPPKGKRPPKPKPQNPIESTIRAFFQTLHSTLFLEISASIDSLISTSPKRWVIYSPMLLLPSGSFSSPHWTSLLSHLEPSQKEVLFTQILQSVSKKEGKKLTHLAINAGIPLHEKERGRDNEDEKKEEENILRSPSGLLMLHGDFGPDFKGGEPTEKDFEEAFWVSTKQNGIEQVWAPRWTMFSRGNVKEKARLLGFHDDTSTASSNGKKEIGKEERRNWTAVDLYAGIGYFVFSYVGMGVGRVVGWELNGWSVEGLRRGAVANGWRIRVVRKGEVVEEVGDERIVVFLESNVEAEQRLERMKGLGTVKHLNCGFLPTSEPAWKAAMNILSEDGWLHLHENVGIADVEIRKREIEEMFQTWLQELVDKRKVKVEHVEFVKTFAPDVWHCVFDVYVSK
ncbi:S-adenosylmethionine-dependent methyltransferase [Ciborinia camelliae]|nr:S-adenosylmethionine-dependent methyltransferase [Ciborinia camelliae]